MTRKDANFVRSAGLLSFLTLVSRILGLLREIICAYFFGAGALWGDFSIAFRIPNLARRLFGEGALSAALIPVLSERFHREGVKPASELLGCVLLLLAAVLLGLVVVGEAGLWLARGFSDDPALSLTAVMLPYMFFICLVAILAAAQNVAGRFGVPALMPILFNVIMIGGVLCGAVVARGDRDLHVRVVAVSVLVAGVAQVYFQWRALMNSSLPARLIWNPHHSEVRRIASSMAPMIIGLGTVQLNSLADLLVAKIFVRHGGGAAVLSFGERLYQLPIGVFGVAIATAIFPQLARLASAGETREFSRILLRGLRLALFLGVPGSLGLFAIREPLVRLLLQRGEFDATATARVAGAVGWYGLGVWAYVTLQVLIRAYYSLGNPRTPMRVTSAMVALNLVLNVVLVQWFEESGIAMATAISASLQVSILAARFGRTGTRFDWGVLAMAGGKVLLASACMTVVLCAILAFVGGWGSGLWATGAGVVLAAGSGAGVFVVAARLLNCEELGFVRRDALPARSERL